MFKRSKLFSLLFAVGFLQMAIGEEGGGAAPTPAPAGDPTPAGGTPAPAAAPVKDEPITNLFADPPEPGDPAAAKPEDGQAKPDDKKTDDAPVEYELTLPEGLQLSEEQLSGVKATLAAAKVSPDQAQPLFDQYVAAVRTTMEQTQNAATKLWTDTQKEWQATIKADPDIGGAKLDASIADTRKGAQALLGDAAAKDLFTALNITGAGNNPAIVKALHKAFSVHAPATPVSGTPSGQAAQRSAGSILYPTQAGLGNASLST